MTAEELTEISRQYDRVTKSMHEWDIEDQSKIVVAMTAYLETIKPILDKYDPNKPKKFIFRRLDES